MQPINTDLYTHQRHPDNTIVRVDGLCGESPEMTADYFQSQIDFHNQVVANLEAQRDKLAAFEAENPPVEIEESDELVPDALSQGEHRLLVGAVRGVVRIERW